MAKFEASLGFKRLSKIGWMDGWMDDEGRKERREEGKK